MKPILNDIALFIAVINSGNFTQAAEQLEIPTSTLSRRISTLEKQIGFKLLNRSTRRVEATAEGWAYYQRCQLLIEEINLAHEEIASHHSIVAGTLKLTCTADFANLYLANCIQTYADNYPKVKIELVLSSRIESLQANQLDLAIRLGTLPDSSMIAYPLGELKTGVYASPAFIKKYPKILTIEDLATLPCIRLNNSEYASHWIFSSLDQNKIRQEHKVITNGRIIAGGQQMAINLTLRSLGIGLLDQHLAQPLVLSGQLLPLLTDWQTATVPIHAVTSSRFMPARVRYFIELLKQIFKI